MLEQPSYVYDDGTASHSHIDNILLCSLVIGFATRFAYVIGGEKISPPPPQDKYAVIDAENFGQIRIYDRKKIKHVVTTSLYLQ